MYKIAKEKFGYQLTFGDTISLEEMKRWREESRAALVGAPKTFGVMIDMRTLLPSGIRADAQAVMVAGQQLYRDAGMQRSCVILQSAIVTMQFKRLAKASGIHAFERYINAEATPDWRAKALGWIEDKTDPDA
jgi:hypothetical protein